MSRKPRKSSNKPHKSSKSKKNEPKKAAGKVGQPGNGAVSGAKSSAEGSTGTPVSVRDLLIKALEFARAGRLKDAGRICKIVLTEVPDHPEALQMAGVVAHQSGNYQNAVEFLAKSIALKPDDAAAYSHLGLALHARGEAKEAVKAYNKALALDPKLAKTHANLGNLHLQQRAYSQAETCLRQAIELDPGNTPAQSSLGTTLKAQGRVAEACAAFEQAIASDPEDDRVHGNLLLTMHYDQTFGAQQIWAETKRWEERHGAPRKPSILPHDNDQDPDRRLRIGYVSPDLRRHSVSYFLEPLLAAHDHDQVEIYCYAEVEKPDDTTGRLRNLAQVWRSSVGSSAEELAARIRADGIDILVDLAGHTGNNRLTAFACKPAPVQVSWLGYPNSTGLSAMDYRLSDQIADPAGEGDALSSEMLIHLPEGFHCYAASADAPAVSPLPAGKAEHITFGSFSATPKITANVVTTWSKILNALPDAHLLLKSYGYTDAATVQRYQDLFAAEGIAAERIKFLPQVPKYHDHLALSWWVDIALDTFPYNGTTTTCEALWMGVPVVTLKGNNQSGRVGASLLTTLGLTDLITESEEAYIEAAVALAGDLDRLAEQRAGLRDLLAGSPLCDGAAFAHKIEAAYRQMWQTWCKSKAA